jgi:hypothetical protein
MDPGESNLRCDVICTVYGKFSSILLALLLRSLAVQSILPVSLLSLFHLLSCKAGVPSEVLAISTEGWRGWSYSRIHHWGEWHG